MQKKKEKKEDKTMGVSMLDDTLKAIQAKFGEAIEKMSVLDLHELVKHLEEKFGVSAAAVAVAAPAAGAAAGEEKSLFTVELKEAGASKINVIKVVK